MAEPLIAPILTPKGSIQFAAVGNDAVAKDVIDMLLGLDGVADEILGELKGDGWALQRVRREEPGRSWEDDELAEYGDGMCF